MQKVTTPLIKSDKQKWMDFVNKELKRLEKYKSK